MQTYSLKASCNLKIYRSRKCLTHQLKSNRPFSIVIRRKIISTASNIDQRRSRLSLALSEFSFFALTINNTSAFNLIILVQRHVFRENASHLRPHLSL